MSHSYSIENLNITFQKNKRSYKEYMPIISNSSVKFQIGNIMLSEYALYIYYEDEVVQKNMYQKSSVFTIEYPELKILSFTLFTKNIDGIERIYYTFSTCKYNYEFDNLKIEYSHIKKKVKNDNILIVFGGANTTTPRQTRQLQSGIFDVGQYAELNNTLRIIPFYRKLIAAPYDIIHITDNFSYGFSWYLYEGTREVDGILVDFLNDFIHKNGYNHSATLGSSKGAFAAINIGNRIKEIDHIFSFAPQIDLDLYLETHRAVYPHFANIDKTKRISKNKNQNSIYIFTGKHDTQYKEQVNYAQLNNCNIVDLGDEYKDHGELITNNHEKVCDEVLEIWYTNNY